MAWERRSCHMRLGPCLVERCLWRSWKLAVVIWKVENEREPSDWMLLGMRRNGEAKDERDAVDIYPFAKRQADSHG